MTELAYERVEANTRAAAPSIAPPAGAAHSPVPLPVLGRDGPARDKPQDGTADDVPGAHAPAQSTNPSARLSSERQGPGRESSTSRRFRLRNPALVAQLRRTVRGHDPEPPLVRQRMLDAFKRTQLDVRGLGTSSGPVGTAAILRRSPSSGDDSPHFFGTDRDSFTGDLWADVKSGAVADRIYSFVGGAADAVVDTATGLVELLKPGGVEKALGNIGKLPGNLKLVFEHRDEFIAAFEALPPKQQARVIGRLTAQIESVLASGLGGGAAATGGMAPQLAEAAVAAGGGAAALQRGGAITIDLAKLGEVGTNLARAGYLTAKAGEGGGEADAAAQKIEKENSNPGASELTDPAGQGVEPAGKDPSWVARRHGADAPAVQAGHRLSRWLVKKAGGVEEFAVEDADLNQLSNWTLETAKKGGVAKKTTILVRGLYVDKASGLLWAGRNTGKLTGLTREFIESFPEVPGWTPPPGCKNPNATFMSEMLKVLEKDPTHPFRFLIDGVGPAKAAVVAPKP